MESNKVFEKNLELHSQRGRTQKHVSEIIFMLKVEAKNLRQTKKYERNAEWMSTRAGHLPRICRLSWRSKPVSS